jgi:hypothetical protein
MSKSLKGTYSFIQDGKVIGVSENLITEVGERVILNYLADKTNSYADAISLGIGDATPTASDKFLNLETFQIPINSRLVDFTKNPKQIIFRSTITPAFTGKIYECGLLAGPDYVLSTSFENIISNPTVLINFDENVEDWDFGTGASYYLDESQQYIRAGKYTVEIDHSVEDSISMTAPFSGIFRSAFNQDIIKLGLYIKDAVPTSITISFKVDGSQSIIWNVNMSGLVADSYNIVEIPIGSLVDVSINNINLTNEVEIVSVDSANLSTVYLDILRIDQYSDISQQILVSKSILDEPIIVSGNIALDVEYRLEIDL